MIKKTFCLILMIFLLIVTTVASAYASVATVSSASKSRSASAQYEAADTAPSYTADVTPVSRRVKYKPAINLMTRTINVRIIDEKSEEEEAKEKGKETREIVEFWGGIVAVLIPIIALIITFCKNTKEGLRQENEATLKAYEELQKDVFNDYNKLLDLVTSEPPAKDSSSPSSTGVDPGSATDADSTNLSESGTNPAAATGSDSIKAPKSGTCPAATVPASNSVSTDVDSARDSDSTSTNKEPKIAGFTISANPIPINEKNQGEVKLGMNYFKRVNSKSGQWNLATKWLVKLEVFSAGINNNIYSKEILNSIGGGYFARVYLALRENIRNRENEGKSTGEHYSHYTKLGEELVSEHYSEYKDPEKITHKSKVKCFKIIPFLSIDSELNEHLNTHPHFRKYIKGLIRRDIANKKSQNNTSPNGR